MEIELGYYGSGSTAGYTHDYDEACPYPGSTSPDEVYTFVIDQDLSIAIDMYGSTYDTKIYVYDEDLQLMACNDDFYDDFVSLIESMDVQAGVRYYLVIDGYGGDSGDYVVEVRDTWGHHLHCEPSMMQEDEPPLTIDYVDLYNGGCNTDPLDPPFQHLDTTEFCGVSGWYLLDGSSYRDTDWFTVTLPSSGTIEIEADGEQASSLFELGPQDCDQVGILQDLEVGPFIARSMTVTGEPGTDVWLWFGPTSYFSPDGSEVYEYDYVMLFSGVVEVEARSWTEVKALFE